MTIGRLMSGTPWGVLVAAFTFFGLQMVFGPRYPVFRDEFYYLACADHPAMGYVDHPPLSILILAAWRSVFGDSIHSLRVLPSLAGGAIVLLTSALAGALGGGVFARTMAAALRVGGAFAFRHHRFLFDECLRFPLLAGGVPPRAPVEPTRARRGDGHVGRAWRGPRPQPAQQDQRAGAGRGPGRGSAGDAAPRSSEVPRTLARGPDRARRCLLRTSFGRCRTTGPRRSS